MKFADGMLNGIPEDIVLRRIRFCRIFLAAGFILGVAFCVFYAVFLGRDYPYSTFLFRPADRFQDFLGVLRMTADRNPYQIKNVIGVLGDSNMIKNVGGVIMYSHYPTEASNYFPFTHLLFYPFTLINKYASLVIYSLFVIGFAVFASAKALGDGLSDSIGQRCLNVLVFTLMSYPLLFTLDRGNIEGIIFIFLACAAWLYLSGRGKLAAACIGLAASIKGFPIIFLIFFVRERRWKELMIGVAVPVCLTIVALLFLEGGVFENLTLLRNALRNFSDLMLFKYNGLTHNISLFSMLYSFWALLHHAFISVASLRPIIAYYYVVAGIIALAVLAYVFFSRLEFWKAWFVLVAAVQLLPFPSYDYKLIHTLVPMFLLIRSGKETRWTRTYLALLCLIVVPKGFWILFFDVRCGTIVNPLLILTVCIMIVVEQYYGTLVCSQRSSIESDLPKKTVTVTE
ncbi:MAG: glycosyltransferase family 87 protein [Deltaproteobacteria bacterium]|nr:glycosyltransferase family 87 protein [Deltaproteobacteria bacterium]